LRILAPILCYTPDSWAKLRAKGRKSTLHSGRAGDISISLISVSRTTQRIFRLPDILASRPMPPLPIVLERYCSSTFPPLPVPSATRLRARKPRRSKTQGPRSRKQKLSKALPWCRSFGMTEPQYCNPGYC